MFSACLFCHGRLGANDAVEHVPVGRRLAFDAAKGRLWVVCPACARWNLVPLEERWEALDECERAYRGSPSRVATGHVGLVRLPSGVELVRVGAPLRPEFAAWRYGDVLDRRWRVARGVGAAAAAGLAVVVAALGVEGTLLASAGALVAYMAAGVATEMRGLAGRLGRARVLERVPVRLAGGDGAELRVGMRRLCEATVVQGGAGWRLLVCHDGGVARVEGPSVERVLGVVLARVNRLGGSAVRVRDAVRLLECALDPHGDGPNYDRLLAPWPGRAAGWGLGTIRYLEPERRLALEMAAHERSERQAMEGELGALRAAWRRAEEVAAIADELLVPPAVAGGMARLRAHR